MDEIKVENITKTDTLDTEIANEVETDSNIATEEKPTNEESVDSTNEPFNDTTLLENDKYEAGQVDDKELSKDILQEDIDEVKKQLESLLIQIQEPDPFRVINTENSQELADEVGVPIGMDVRGREILSNCFENVLRMSKTQLKLAYSYIKNLFLEMKNVKQQFSGLVEIIKLDEKPLAQFEIDGDDLLLYLNIDTKLSSKQFNYTKVTDEAHNGFNILLKIKKGCDENEYMLISKFDDVFEKIVKENNLEKDEEAIFIPYAQRYQINPNAVLEGNEASEPVDYSLFDYDSVDNEAEFDIKAYLDSKHVENLNTVEIEQELDNVRQSANNLKAATSLTEPIVYFFDSALDRANETKYVNVKQVLNDKFIGKILPPMYEFIASTSERIELLNFYALDDTIALCNDNEKLTFCLKLSCRLISNKKSFKLLLKKLEQLQYPNLILSFDAQNLEALKKLAIDSLLEIRDKNCQIMIDGIENSSLKVLTDFPINYLRLDSRYYKESNKNSIALMETIINFCQFQGITSIISGPETSKEAKFYLNYKVEVVEGFAIGEPKRILYQAVKNIKKLPIVE
ncbi:MAG: EAL domain-containing protein [Clostridia bacterium]|nr:EAL domain-containing protein [Clostridia bacterium]